MKTKYRFFNVLLIGVLAWGGCVSTSSTDEEDVMQSALGSYGRIYLSELAQHGFDPAFFEAPEFYVEKANTHFARVYPDRNRIEYGMEGPLAYLGRSATSEERRGVHVNLYRHLPERWRTLTYEVICLRLDKNGGLVGHERSEIGVDDDFGKSLQWQWKHKTEEFDPEKIGAIIKGSDVETLNRIIVNEDGKAKYGFDVSFYEYSYGSGELEPLMKFSIEVTSDILKESYVFQMFTSSPSGAPSPRTFFVMIKGRVFWVHLMEQKAYPGISQESVHSAFNQAIDDIIGFTQK